MLTDTLVPATPVASTLVAALGAALDAGVALVRDALGSNPGLGVLASGSLTCLALGARRLRRASLPLERQCPAPSVQAALVASAPPPRDDGAPPMRPPTVRWIRARVVPAATEAPREPSGPGSLEAPASPSRQ